MARVLILSCDYPPLVGGVSAFSNGLAAALSAEGHTVSVVTTVGGRDEAPWCVRRSPGWLDRKVVKLLPLAWMAVAEVRRRRPDAVIAMTWVHEGLIAALLRAVTRVPFVVVVHGSELTQASPLRRRIMRSVLRAASSVATNSHHTAGLVGSEVPPGTHVLVVNPPVARPSQPSGDAAVRYGIAGAPVLLTVGRLVARKGHAVVLDALPALIQAHPRLVYAVVGDGPLGGALSELVADRGLSGHVVFTGRVPDRDLPGLYDLADVYVSGAQDASGDIEGFGIALGEASSYGLPVVAELAGGVASVVQDAVTGLLIDFTPPQVAAAVGRLLADDALRARLGVAGAERMASARRPVGEILRLEPVDA